MASTRSRGLSILKGLDGVADGAVQGDLGVFVQGDHDPLGQLLDVGRLGGVLEGVLDLGAQEVHVAGFGQVVEGPGVERLLGPGHVAVAGEHDHRQLRQLVLDQFECFVAVQAAHFDIQNDDVRLFGQFFQRLFPTGRQDRVESFAGQYLRSGGAEAFLIVDHEDLDFNHYNLLEVS